MKGGRKESLASSRRDPAGVHVAFITVAVALTTIILLTPGLRGLKIYPSAYSTTEAERTIVNSSALASILGEVRASAADFVWLKTEYYMHRGVHYKPHTSLAEIKPGEPSPQTQAAVQDMKAPAEKELAKEDEHGHDRDHDHDHNHDHKHEHVSNAPTLIPTEDKDFRGFIGTIDRAIHPWQQTTVHHLANADQILPWYRLVTMINPYHARAYLVGGYLLMKEYETPDHLDQAGQFLQEGIHNNPEAFNLRVLFGRVEIQQKRWKEAIRTFEKARNVALKYRSEDGAASTTWSESDEEDFGFSVRYLPFIQFRVLGDAKAAIKSCQDGLRYMPKDGPLKNFLKELLQETQPAPK
jgi:hypothetical protein